MRSHFAKALLTAAMVCITAAPYVKAQEDSAANRAIRAVNQGNVEGAIDLLNKHLEKNSKDVQARVVLGQILDFDGRPDEAVKLWERALTGADTDFPLLMSIGEIRSRQGRDGPAVSNRRGMVQVKPSTNKAEEAAFKKAKLAEAEAAYDKARKLRPAEEDAAEALAAVYSLEEKHDAAAQVWKSLIEREPKDADYQLQLALTTRQAGRADEAARYLERAIALDPRLAEAHKALAEFQKQKGRAAEAEQSQSRADFYERLPVFCTIEYSAENRNTLDQLQEPETVRKLVADPSKTAAEFLAVLCWTHPHNNLETTAFDALESRGAATTPILQALFKDARSTCTVRSTARILARRKTDRLLEDLLKRLPGDLRGFGMEMDIAGSLDELGDPRAIAPLIEILNPAQVDRSGDGLLTDRTTARRRAALALGAFDTPESRRALEQGTQSPQVKAYCLAALYRLTKDQKHLDALEAAVPPKESFATYVIGNYLRNKVPTEAASALAQRWQREREAEDAAAKTKTAEPAPAKRKN
jgi:tetratricopeptide (TPR) repeat protein